MTADPTALRLLAEEVEKLTGRGSFDIECRIVGALYPVRIDGASAIWTEDGMAGTRSRIPAYTRSIDDAAALMPAGWWVDIEAPSDDVPDRGLVEARRWQDVGDNGERHELYEFCDVPSTEAIMRTACALRAIAAEREGKNG